MFETAKGSPPAMPTASVPWSTVSTSTTPSGPSSSIVARRVPCCLIPDRQRRRRLAARAGAPAQEAHQAAAARRRGRMELAPGLAEGHALGTVRGLDIVHRDVHVRYSIGPLGHMVNLPEEERGMNPGPFLSTGRYAPSPTGSLHLGNLRTALIAWLWSRRRGGRFLMRM